MGRINRRIYSTRRKRSPNKLRFANPRSMSSELINQMGQAQASGNLNMGLLQGDVRPKTPPYLGDSSSGDEEGFSKGKTYTITEA